ncbi:MAG: tRNA (uracil-5-)-methyltransferase [Pseudomonadota bacterium]|nr:tRNA (uracil-5-)-methyltransferase [Pseudomonadota bacterium]
MIDIGSVEARLADSKVVDFAKAGEKHRAERSHKGKEDKVDEMRKRFEGALPTKKTPVKDFLRKKKAKKKR